MNGKARVRLIGLDIDGTLLNSERRVTARVASAIRRAADAGVAVAYVTGRPLSGVLTGGVLTDGVRYAITSNGAMTYDLSDGAVLRSRCVPKADAKRIARIPMARGLIHSVFAGGYGYCERRFYDMLLARYAGGRAYAYMRDTKRAVDDLDAFIDASPDGVENIWICPASPEEKRAIEAELAAWPHLISVTTGGRDIELGHGEADKGAAFLALAERLGVAREETMAAGDDLNDAGLLRAAGTAVAMGNAHADILALCPYATPDNDHDGAALAIERFALD